MSFFQLKTDYLRKNNENQKFEMIMNKNPKIYKITLNKLINLYKYMF